MSDIQVRAPGGFVDGTGTVKIYSSDGSTELFKMSTDGSVKVTITETGATLAEIMLGVETGKTDEFVYEGDKQFLGFLCVTSNNSPDGRSLAVGETHTLSGAALWVVEAAEETSTPTTITYNGTTLAELEAGQTATFPQGVKAKTDVSIAFGSKGSITYKGVTTEIEAGKTANLLCSGKKFGTDVVVSVESASGASGYSVTVTVAKSPEEYGIYINDGEVTDTLGGMDYPITATYQNVRSLWINCGMSITVDSYTNGTYEYGLDGTYELQFTPTGDNATISVVC